MAIANIYNWDTFVHAQNIDAFGTVTYEDPGFSFGSLTARYATGYFAELYGYSAGGSTLYMDDLYYKDNQGNTFCVIDLNQFMDLSSLNQTINYTNINFSAGSDYVDSRNMGGSSNSSLYNVVSTGDPIMDFSTGTDYFYVDSSSTNLNISGATANSIVVNNQTLLNLEFLILNDGTYSVEQLLSKESPNTTVPTPSQPTITLDLSNPNNVFRFFNTETGTHFYSNSVPESTVIMASLPQFQLEGTAFRSADIANGLTASVYRFNNTQTGTHFFTQSAIERDSILNNLPHYSFEGEAYLCYPEEVRGSTPLYRFFNTETGTHFYTANEFEKVSLAGTNSVFSFEGVAYWVDPVMGGTPSIR